MKDLRRSQEYKQWKNAVRHRDGSACRRCGFEKNLHVHHIKPFDRYPQFALEIENGLTLCGNCHSILSGKEETTDLRLFLEGETKIDQQLRAIEGKFSTYLERELRSGIERTREEGVRALFRHLSVYSNSFSEMIQHLVFVVDSDEWADESPTKRRAIEWLSQTISGEEVECTSCQGKVRIPFRKARIRQPNEKIDVAQLDDQKLEQLAERIESGVITDNALKRAVQETAAARTKDREMSKIITCNHCRNEFRHNRAEGGPPPKLVGTPMAVQALSRYEQRAEQKRVEEQARQTLEAQKKEAERREAKQRWEQEIIAKYGSLEAHKQHLEYQMQKKKDDEIIASLITLGCFVGLCFLATLAGGC